MENFEEYLEKYCVTRRVCVNEAVKHKTVQLVGEYYGLTQKEIVACGYLPFA